jgi:protein-tyrosine phosphatase
LAAVSLAACAAPRPAREAAPPAGPVAERLDAGSVRLRWPASFASGPVVVFAGPAPERIARAQPLAVADGGSITLRASGARPELRADRRLYYELVPVGGESRLVAERRLPLAGADNFRDLGGYQTRDGRFLRWGRLYRSNELSDLSGEDVRYLSRLGLRLVCDLRSQGERAARPSRVAGAPAPASLVLPVSEEGVDPETMRGRIRSGGIAALSVEATMLDAYRSFPGEHAAAWSALFARLARPENLPTLVHCTAGKDRTGFAAALVLLALGVPEATVFEDYLLTNVYRDDFRRRVERWVPLYSLFRTRPEDVLPLIEARATYLRASLDAIAAGWGSVDGYLEQALGVDAETRAALEANLLH